MGGGGGKEIHDSCVIPQDCEVREGEHRVVSLSTNPVVI